jgi:peptidoglycan hydrolase-like protein with peptidoglycan-binding domain
MPASLGNAHGRGNGSRSYAAWQALAAIRADGRIGGATTAAVQNFQRKAGMTPVAGYRGVGLLARLRRGPRSGWMRPRNVP